MDSIEASDRRSIVLECPFLTHGDTPTISDEEAGGMKPIRVILPKNPWGESLRQPLSFSSYPSRFGLPNNASLVEDPLAPVLDGRAVEISRVF